MKQSLQRRLPMVPPVVPAPPPFAERRQRTRRAIDAAANVEISFLAGAFDVLAGVGSAEERLAALLNLIAETAGAERAAVLADGGERRVAVSVQPDEDPRTHAAWPRGSMRGRPGPEPIAPHRPRTGVAGPAAVPRRA